MTGIISEHMHN